MRRVVIFITIIIYNSSIEISKIANFDCRSSLEKLQETEERKNSELKYLRRCGIAVEIDLREKDKQPCLINLTADPMLSGTLLYLIPPGLVRIGKHSENSETFKKVPLDIVLDGPLVRKLHWLVVDFEGRFLQQSRRSSSSLFEASRSTTSRDTTPRFFLHFAFCF
ncbi:kinesin-like protein KIF14 [Vespula maculifrons]|uniref:Kinesin-like protein KIF14 n=1 Tax=Vespula maculifrons TaxID=7453 RepID=A0ABD2BQQ5_VESMC